MLVDRINALLPQTQCTKCGYAGCKPYAQALADKQADINRCPPGGDAGIAALARLLELPVIALDESCGRHIPLQVAVIDEQHCIGCTLCIQACPVDAILGANKFMHTVLQSDCTGCDLCVAPCPVDCITMVAVEPARQWTTDDAMLARERYEKRQRRLSAPEKEEEPQPVALVDKQAAIAQALLRARARRQQ
ncbi:RnfABCDGE type electron transport complex subunit B [Orrella sp. NBD-18]|uniref:RnfABCDGE type electron transport complex subunit B n=1 Tax=Sheuella amnicola TaxID=2707330 RepID=A0A6B2R263_9BURK|nr:RnfABCDGE type electron transport complex subunit B [Sheuella amnicola]NDY83107.1 RnfABCDGE type electron transport complex subunit B [Sheuella amnicola]HBI83046.1 electron transport complex subunit RsxB [Alcaligenaceae bacterium]